MTRFVLLGVVTLGIAGPTVGQLELPEELRMSVSPPQIWAADMTLAEAESGVTVRCSVGFENLVSGTLILDWVYSKSLPSGEQSGFLKETRSLAYLPTAVCVRAAKSNVLYVAGWLPRQSAMILEEWTFGAGAVGVTILPSGEEDLTFAAPTVTKRVLFISDSTSGLLPPTGLACNVMADTLWFIPFDEPRRILEVPIDGAESGTSCGEWAGDPCLVVDQTSHPVLEEMVALATYMHLTDGFVLVAQGFPLWSTSWQSGASQDVIVFVDADLDGVIPTAAIQQTDIAAFKQQFGMQNWIIDYAEP